MTAAGNAQALAGIRVLDLSRVLAGPWATQILGDLGAEVIKIERPGIGDDTRSWGPPWHGGSDEERGTSGYFLACNRNKRSVAVDFAQPQGAALIRKMAAEADVLVENFKVGTLARYGLDYDSLRAVNPRLVYCSVTGFGQSGPYAERGGYDFLIQAMSGLMSVTGPLGGEPTKVGVPVIDLFTGLYAVIGIQAALQARARTGRGQHVDCALLDTAVAILANQGMNYLVGGAIPVPLGNGHPNVVPYRPFQAADGHVIVTAGNDRQFRSFCAVLGRQDLADAPEYATNALRVANREALEAALAGEVARRHSDELLAAMDLAGVPGGPINTLDKVFADAQVAARGMVREFCPDDGSDDGPADGPADAPILRLTRFPALLSETPATIRDLPAPRIGAHTRQVLTSMGLGTDEIAALAQAGVLAGD